MYERALLHDRGEFLKGKHACVKIESMMCSFKVHSHDNTQKSLVWKLYIQEGFQGKYLGGLKTFDLIKLFTCMQDYHTMKPIIPYN